MQNREDLDVSYTCLSLEWFMEANSYSGPFWKELEWKVSKSSLPVDTWISELSLVNYPYASF